MKSLGLALILMFSLNLFGEMVAGHCHEDAAGDEIEASVGDSLHAATDAGPAAHETGHQAHVCHIGHCGHVTLPIALPSLRRPQEAAVWLCRIDRLSSRHVDPLLRPPIA